MMAINAGLLAIQVYTLYSLVSVLKPEDFGHYSLGIAFGTLLAALSGLGGDRALLMSGSRDPATISRSVALSLRHRVLGSAGALLLSASAAYLFLPSHASFSVTVIIFSQILMGFYEPHFTTIQRLHDSFLVPKLYLALYRLLFLGALTIVEDSPNALFKIGIIHLLGSVLLLAPLLFWLARNPDSWRSSPWLYYSTLPHQFGFWASNLVDTALSRIDFYLIHAFYGPTSLGLYSFGFRIADSTSIIPASINSIQMPAFHRASANESELRIAFIKCRNGLRDVGCITGCSLFLLADLIVRLVNQPQYFASAAVLKSLCVFVFLNFIGYSYSMYLEARARIQHRLLAKGISLFVIICLFFVLSSAIELWCAAFIGSLGLFSFIFISHYAILREPVGVISFFKFIGPCLPYLIGVACAVLFSYLDPWSPDTDVLGLPGFMIGFVVAHIVQVAIFFTVAQFVILITRLVSCRWSQNVKSTV